MAMVRDRHNPVRLFGRRLLIIGLLALLILAIPGVWGAYRKERESRALRTEAEVQLSDLSTREAELNADIAKLESDRGKEEALREQYALAKRGEGLIIIVDPRESQEVRATSTLMRLVRKFLPFW